jgi:hypothetical protein
MKKLLVLIATTVSLSLAASNSYKVTLFQPSVISGQELKPGDYKVEVNGDKMTIKNGKNSVEAPVKVETGDAKFSSTSVRYDNGNGKYKVQEIRIGGTTTKLVVGENTAAAGGAQ